MNKVLVTMGILLLTLPAMAGWRDGSSEFELFAGPHIGDTFTLETDWGEGYRMEVKDSVLLGMRGSYFFADNAAIEFTLAGTRSQTTEGDDFDFYYYHGNILYQFGHAAFAPFVTLGIGVTTTRHPDPGMGGWRRVTESDFSWNFGGGFKIYFNKNFALRTDLRTYWTNINSRHCEDNEDCWNNENVLATTEISAGFVFSF